MQWKPKGSRKADSPSDTQDINMAGYMEHQDNVQDRKDRPSSQRNEKIQDQSAWTVWDKVDTVRTAQTHPESSCCTQDTSRREPPILRVWPWCWHQRHMRHSSAGSLSALASSQPSLPPRRKTSGWTSSSAMLPPMIQRKRRRMTSTNSYKQC